MDNTGDTTEDIAALEIAIRLMGMHLEYLTPGGAGRDSKAYQTALGRVAVLKQMLARARRGEAMR